MKKCLTVGIACMAALLATSCGDNGHREAEELLACAERLYADGNYRACLDSITSLRTRYAEAVEVRHKALKLWQDASLKMTQEDIARTDSALQATLLQIDQEHNLYRQNMLRAKRDSLQIRYDALCGTVRIIHQRQQE